jgi:hypothetical protein
MWLFKRDRRLDDLIARFDEFEETDKAWKAKHASNHHGKMSAVKDKVPWTILMFLAYGIMNYIVNGTTP